MNSPGIPGVGDGAMVLVSDTGTRVTVAVDGSGIAVIGISEILM